VSTHTEQVTGGNWRDAYQPPSRPITLHHQGGPADGTHLTIRLHDLTHTRWYAPATERRRRRVTLHRYVRHDPIAVDTIRYLWTGTDERRGPWPGQPESPAWST
jgi:hypothetical protein